MSCQSYINAWHEHKIDLFQSPSMRIDKCVGSNCLLVLCAMLESSDCKRRWTYEFLSMEAYSENETKLKPDMRIERVGRHQVGVSGTLDWQYDIDKTTMVGYQENGIGACNLTYLMLYAR